MTENQARPGQGPSHHTTLFARLWRVLLTGVPFGVFKIAAGAAAWEDVHPGVGVAFMLWGATDILLNLLHLAMPRRFSFCSLSNAGLLVDRFSATRDMEAVGLALDTLCSFAIVATMIWFGRIGALPWLLLRCWELSVICNVLAVGVERLYHALRVRAAPA